MFNDDDGDPLLPDLFNVFNHEHGFLMIHACSGLVQHQDFRVGCQRYGDAQHSLITIGELFPWNESVVKEIEQPEDIENAPHDALMLVPVCPGSKECLPVA